MIYASLVIISCIFGHLSIRGSCTKGPLKARAFPELGGGDLRAPLEAGVFPQRGGIVETLCLGGFEAFNESTKRCVRSGWTRPVT